jgi:hypothetical protein
MLRKICPFIIGLLLPLSTFAWGVTGHRVVGEIASKHLTPQARKAVAAILGKQSMAMVSNWPDLIKSDTTHQYDHMYHWHFVDLPAHSSRAQFDKLIPEIKGENLYTETEALLKKLKDPSTSQADKKFALTFLIHMIGDMHQPLHVGRDEDQGGNKIQVTWFDRPTNLHRVWDEHLVEFQQLSYTEYTQAIDTASLAEIKRLQSGSIMDWMFESNQLADKVYDYTKPNDKLSYRYNYVFVNNLNEQLLKGGLRLAALLNNTFK